MVKAEVSRRANVNGETVELRFRRSLSRLLDAGLNVAQSHQRSRREHPALAHPAAERLAQAARAPDEGVGAHQHRPDWRTHALAQAHAHRVRGRDQPVHGHPQRHCRIEDARAVYVQRDVVLAADEADGVRVLRREHAAAGFVVRVLQADEAGHREVVVVWTDSRLDLRRARGGVGEARRRKMKCGESEMMMCF